MSFDDASATCFSPWIPCDLIALVRCFRVFCNSSYLVMAIGDVYGKWEHRGSI